VTLREGRFGPYVQLGEGANGEKPKRTSVPKGTDLSSIDLERALKLLALPREIGRHPETGDPVLAGIGRFGTYVQHGKTYANLEAGDDVLALGLNRAVALLADKAKKGGRGRKFGSDPGRSLGEHPQKGGAVIARSGRYGPYVSHEGVNATLPRDKTPESVTLDEAVALIDAKREAGHSAPTKRRSPAKKRQSPAAAAAAAPPTRKVARKKKTAK
jgi:DNA topoisomerase-1